MIPLLSLLLITTPQTIVAEKTKPIIPVEFHVYPDKQHCQLNIKGTKYQTLIVNLDNKTTFKVEILSDIMTNIVPIPCNTKIIDIYNNYDEEILILL